MQVPNIGGRSRGFTLIEILIVLVVIAVIATMAIPALLSSKLQTNETAALAAVRNVVQAQINFASRRAADLNGNGSGEFATLGELSAGVAVRAAAGGTDTLAPTELANSFRNVSAEGLVARQGYFFRVFLPDALDNGVPELAGGGADATVDAGRAENLWCIYAWPQQYGATGLKTYFANANGDILFTDDARYTGRTAPIAAGAALEEPGVLTGMNGIIATAGVGRDGATWKTTGR